MTTTFQSTIGKIRSTDDIEGLGGRELVTLHNELAAKIGTKFTKRFSNRDNGIRRVTALFEQLGDSAPSISTGQNTKPAAGKIGDVARRKRFSIESRDKIKSHRAGTKRAKVIDLLSRDGGATIEDVMKANGWDYRTAFEGIKLVATYVGYGLTEDDEGNIELTG